MDALFIGIVFGSGIALGFAMGMLVAGLIMRVDSSEAAAAKKRLDREISLSNAVIEAQACRGGRIGVKREEGNRRAGNGRHGTNETHGTKFEI
jgi:NhaP-type Na+/H+ or K+/H+ antiporter